MAIENAPAKQEEDIGALQNESSGIASQIRQQQDIAERNDGLVSKIEGWIRMLDGKMEEALNYGQRQERQLEQQCQLPREKDAEVSRLLIERNHATSEFDQSSKGTKEVSNGVHELEDAIQKHVTAQSDLKRPRSRRRTLVIRSRQRTVNSATSRTTLCGCGSTN
jgi:hypothetical protein